MNRIIMGLGIIATLLLAPAAQAANLEGNVTAAKGNAGLIVFVTKAPGTFAPPAAHPHVDQVRMKFTPRVLPVVVGTSVDFINSDSVNHNVFSPDNEGYNLGTWAKGDKRSYTFKREGVYTQLCSLHPEMEAFILVLGNSYFATTGADGHFSIANVPAGHYQLQVWGEKLKGPEKKKTFPVDVTADGAKTTLAL